MLTHIFTFVNVYVKMAMGFRKGEKMKAKKIIISITAILLIISLLCIGSLACANTGTASWTSYTTLKGTTSAGACIYRTKYQAYVNLVKRYSMASDPYETITVTCDTVVKTNATATDSVSISSAANRATSYNNWQVKCYGCNFQSSLVYSGQAVANP